MKLLKVILLSFPLFAFGTLLFTGPAIIGISGGSLAIASCKCKCVLGEVVAVCGSSLDVRPFCPPKICPFVDPNAPTPKLGAAECGQEQVWDPYTSEYKWQSKC